jgi:hypothetical protein
MIGPSCAYAQSEIDPDHFDSPNTEPIPQTRTVDSKVRVTWYNGTFFLPYSVLCNGKKLAPGKYSVSLRSDDTVGQATLNQKGHAIEISRVVQTGAPKQRDEVVVEENNKNVRTLSLVRVSGFAFVFDPKHSADPSSGGRPTHAEKLPLTVVTPNEIANKVPSRGSPKP